MRKTSGLPTALQALPGGTILIILLLLAAAQMATVTAQSFHKITSGEVVSNGGISGGVSWIDYNGDGNLDLFLTNAQGEANFLYRNEGGGDFARIATGDIVTALNRSAGNTWGDFDNDGDPDLFISNQQENDILYRNEGDGSFYRITSGIIVNQPGDSHHSTWGDYDNDGFLDLFVANSGFGSPERNYLYRGNGDGMFEEITEGNHVTLSRQTFGGNWADYDDDGDIDLYVSRYDNRNNFLYRNEGDGSFQRITGEEIVLNNGYSIGSSWADYDNDGDVDLFVANWGNTVNFLYRNEGGGQFARIVSGPVVTDIATSWVGAWGDYDNDGDLDLFVTNYDQDNTLYSNNGDGTFTAETGSILSTDGGLSSGTCWGDYDGDGDLDLIVANWDDQNNYLYRNDGVVNNWINIECAGTLSNRSGIGAKVKVKAALGGTDVWQMREISGNFGLRSQSGLGAWFGLANAGVVDSLLIEWPSGAIDIHTNIGANQTITFTEGITSTGVEVGAGDSPPPVLLNRNYPNPFNPTTTIEYRLPEDQHIVISVYDLIGKEVITLLSERKPAGRNTIVWNGTDHTGKPVGSGVYTYRIVADGFTQSHKMTLVR